MGQLEETAAQQQQLQLQQQQQDHIETILRENENIPIKIASVNITGAQDINPQTLQSHLDATIFKAKTLRELSGRTETLNRKLVQNGLVKDIRQGFDSLGIVDNEVTGSALNLVSHLQIVPINKFLAKTGTNVGNGEGDGYLEFQLRNPLGNGELFRFNVMKGTKIQSSYLFQASSLLTPFWNMNLDLFKNVTEPARNLPLELGVVGGKFAIRSGFIQSDSRWNYEFFTQSMLRSCTNTSLSASDSVLFQTGDDFKRTLGLSLIHI